MVAMGTSFADLAWGRDSAVYRITGVLTVIAGWFVTALFAFTLSGAMAVAIFYGQVYGVIGLIILATLIIWKNHAKHSERSKRKEMDQVFNLKKVTDANETISISSRHMGILLREIRLSLDAALDALFAQNIDRLNVEMKKTKKLQRWANIIIANVFKSMRLLQKEHMVFSHMYGQTVRRVQKVVDGHRDIVTRAYSHISNHHKGLLDVQIMELQEVKRLLSDIIQGVETDLGNKELKHQKMIIQKDRELRALAEKLNRDQIERIQSGESKTRLSILFYDIVGNAMMLSKQNLKLMEIFAGTFGGENKQAEFDMD
jgi:Na+/phosphate symporter